MIQMWKSESEREKKRVREEKRESEREEKREKVRERERVLGSSRAIELQVTFD